MTALAYAIVRDADPFRGPLPGGIAGPPLRLVAAEGLAFACSDGPVPAEADVGWLLDYARTVDALHRLGTILPLRYGTTGTDDALAARLRARRDEFAADLARLDGCEEMTVRVPLPAPDEPSPPPSPATPGAAYLLARRQRYAGGDGRRAAAERLVRDCRDRFAGLFVDVSGEAPAAGPQDSYCVHFLIRRGTGGQLTTAVRREAVRFPGPCRVSGPWPAYHFLTPPPSLFSGVRPSPG